LITRGITLVPATLVPFFTGVLLCRVAITISLRELIFRSSSTSTFKSPFSAAKKSIFPSFIVEKSKPHPAVCSLILIAASFS